MLRHLLLYLFLLTPFLSKAQAYHQIPYTTASSLTIAGNTVGITPINAATQGSICNLSNSYALQTGINGSGSSFLYSFSAPVSHIRIRLLDMNIGDFVGVKINSDPNLYPLSYNEVTPINPALNLTCNNQTADSIENNLLTTYSPTSTQGRSAQIDLNPGYQIFTFEFLYIQQPAGSGSAIYEIYFVNDTCGSNTLTVTPNTPCEGQSLTLTPGNIPTGVTSFSWSALPPNTFTSTNQNVTIPNVTLADAGTYNLTATRGNCTYSVSVPVSIKTNPVVTAISSSPALPCPGQNIYLSAQADSAGSTYNWVGPNNFTATQQNPTVTNTSFLSQGTYHVTATYNGCTSASKSTTVTLASNIVTPQASNNGPVCPTQTLQLSASIVPDPNATYLWIGPGNFSTTTKDPAISNVSFADSGWYYVSSVVNGCQSFPDSTHVEVAILTPTPAADSAIVVCPGTPLNLNAANINGATFSWTGPAFPTPAPVQNPSVPNATYTYAGKYFVTATVNGCKSLPDSTEVIVKITTPTPETDSVTIACPNTELKLSVDTLPTATYTWKGPGNYSSTLQNPVIPNASNSLSGKYYVRAIIDGCISMADSTVVVVEITTPTPEAGSNGPVCEGSDLQLTASPIPNADYSWKGPGSYSSNAQNPSIKSAAAEHAGKYIVQANVDGCISLPDTVEIAVKKAPTVSINGNDIICENDTLLLTAQTEHDASGYLWTLPNGSTTPEKYIIVNNADISAGGTYTVYTNYDGCQSLMPASVDVKVKPLPSIPVASSNSGTKDSARKAGQELKLYGTSQTPGVTYLWQGPGGFRSNEQNPVVPNVSKLNQGIYVLTSTMDGCSTSSETEVFISTSNYWVLYPNPNEGSFTLKASLTKDQPAEMEIVNAVGQVVYRDKGEVKGKLLFKTFSLGENLSNGVYILHVLLEEDEDLTIRFVISR